MRPMFNDETPGPVLWSRVAVQLVVLELRKPRSSGLTPNEATRIVLYDLPPFGYTWLRFALHSLAVYLGLGWSASQWLRQVAEQAAYGSILRRCFFFAYKDNRRAYPRVTNRGVQDPSEADQSSMALG